MITPNSQPKYCKMNHVLSFYNGLHENLPETYTCRHCEATPLLTRAGIYACIECKYYICLNCADHLNIEKQNNCLHCKQPLVVANKEMIIHDIQERLTCQSCQRRTVFEEEEDPCELHFFYYCYECRYAYCQRCGDQMKEFSKVCCANSHEMKYIRFAWSLANVQESYQCDFCLVSNFSGSFDRLACIHCIYNICPRCKHPKAKVLITTCDNNHHLKYTIDLRHPQTVEKGEINVYEYSCNICKRTKLDSRAGLYACFNDHRYFVCLHCREPLKYAFSTCLKNHGLIFTNDIKVPRDVDSWIDTYICNVCGKQELDSRSGRFSCENCRYNLCWACKKPNKFPAKTCIKYHELSIKEGISREELFKIYKCPECLTFPANSIMMIDIEEEKCRECKNVNLFSIPKTDQTEFFKCSICKAFPVSNRVETYKCFDCDFHICWNCRNPHEESKGLIEESKPKKCSKNHPLVFTIKGKNDNHKKVQCFECKKPIEGIQGMYKCPKCVYVKCLRCEIPTFLHKKLCNKFHPLLYECGNPPKENLNSKSYKCQVCLEEKEYSFPRMICQECQYEVCFDCATPLKGFLSENLECPKDKQKIVITHDNYGNEFTYLCDFCLKQKECRKGRWKCKECNYSICPECVKLPKSGRCTICFQDEYNTEKLVCKKDQHSFIACKKCKKKFSECPLCSEFKK